MTRRMLAVMELTSGSFATCTVTFSRKLKQKPVTKSISNNGSIVPSGLLTVATDSRLFFGTCGKNGVNLSHKNKVWTSETGCNGFTSMYAERSRKKYAFAMEKFHWICG
jgi:hypothetical protein